MQLYDMTLPQLLMYNAHRFSDRVALREKEFGIWQTVTWRQFADHVRAFAMGLRALGVQRGDKVAIIGDNRPEWLYAELAAQAIGGASIGVYQDSVAEEVRYLVEAADARVIVAEDQEQVDKIIEIWPRTPRYSQGHLLRTERIAPLSGTVPRQLPRN
ncbi:MAG: AMP-binding protein [Roseiflexaceae bacterium]|nr:AMP-binding protein [Roseiflexaceae bacterium]